MSTQSGQSSEFILVKTRQTDQDSPLEAAPGEQHQHCVNTLNPSPSWHQGHTVSTNFQEGLKELVFLTTKRSVLHSLGLTAAVGCLSFPGVWDRVFLPRARQYPFTIGDKRESVHYLPPRAPAPSLRLLTARASGA